MRIRTGLAIVVLGLLVACGGDHEKAKTYENAICACVNDPAPAACADQVTKDFGEWIRATRDHADREVLASLDAGSACATRAATAGEQRTMRSITDRMCACASKKDQDAIDCADRVTKDMGAFSKKMMMKYQDTRPSVADQKAFVAEHERYDDCETKVRTAGGPPPPPRSSDGDTGIPECNEYLKAIDKLLACDKLPRSAKDAAKQGTAQMKQGWAMLEDPNTPSEAKKAAGDTCKQALDELKQSAAELGCSI